MVLTRPAHDVPAPAGRPGLGSWNLANLKSHGSPGERDASLRRAVARPAWALGWWRSAREPPPGTGCLLCPVGPGPPSEPLPRAALWPRGSSTVACLRCQPFPCASPLGLVSVSSPLSFVCSLTPAHARSLIHSLLRAAQGLRGQAQSHRAGSAPLLCAGCLGANRSIQRAWCSSWGCQEGGGLVRARAAAGPCPSCVSVPPLLM